MPAEELVLDRGYSWVVFLASFFNQFVSLGIPFSFGVYNVEFLDYFKESKAATAWVCSINIGVLMGCGPLTAWLMSRFSERSVSCVGAFLCTVGTASMYFSTSVYHLYISYGLITGFGYCLVYIPSAVLVGQYFDKYRSATTGICSVGGSLAILILPFLYNYTIDKYTWKGSVFVLASINMQTMVCSALLRPQKTPTELPNPTEQDVHISPSVDPETGSLTFNNITDVDPDSPDGPRENSDVKTCNTLINTPVYRSRSLVGLHNTKPLPEKLTSHVMVDFDFLVYFLSNIFWNIGTGILVIVPVDYLYENGTDKETASMVVTMCGGGGLVGGSIAGVLGNYPRCNRTLLYIVCNVAAGITGLLYLVSTNAVYIIVCSAAFGFAMGAIVSLLVVLSADIVGIQRLGQAFGYLMFSNGVGNLAGPPLAGLLFDVSGNYRSSLALAGVLNILGGLVMFLIHIRRWFVHRYKPHTNHGQPADQLSPLSQQLSPLSQELATNQVLSIR